MNEADTCRNYVLPKLKSAGWEELRPFREGAAADVDMAPEHSERDAVRGATRREGRLTENCEDPKGFLGYWSTRQARQSFLSGCWSAGKTFRVSDGEGQCARLVRKLEMSDIRLFKIENNHVSVIEGQSVAIEKSLQTLLENHLETFWACA